MTDKDRHSDSHHHADHDHADAGSSALSDIALRVRALEDLLVEKGVVERAALDKIVEAYETAIGPRNGARVVARAWSDPDYKQSACCPMRRRRSPNSAIGACRARIWSCSRTRRPCTTSSFARSAPAIHGW